MTSLACRLGSGAGFAGDRVDAAVRMVAAGEVDARRDVPPLIASARLEFAAEPVVEFQKVARLQQHVAEFGERNSGIAVESSRNRVFGEHLSNPEVFAYIAKKVDGAHRVGPV